MDKRCVIADMIIFGGDIFTLDEHNSKVEAIVVTGGRISAVGSLCDAMKSVDNHTQVIYLEKKSLFPGFIEAHQHAVLRTLFSLGCTDIGAFYLNTAEEVMNKIREEVKTATAHTTEVASIPWCVFHGWDSELISNLPKLSAKYIETEFSDRIPIMIISQSIHSAWVNRKVFEIIGVDTKSKKECDFFVRDREGKLTGQILGCVLSLFLNSLSLTQHEIANALKKTFNDYSSRGFTTITEMAYNPNNSLDNLITKIVPKEDCPIRLALYQMINEEHAIGDMHHLSSPNTDKLWMAGIKLWADGSPHTGTIAVREPLLTSMVSETLSFPTSPNYGRLNYTTKAIREKIEHYHQLGAQVAVHAHGERAVEQVLSVFQRIIPEQDCHIRHRIEHLGLATEEQLKACGKMGLAPSFFVYHLYLYGSVFSESILGKERTDRWASLASALKHNCKISIHQDNPAIPGPPLPFLNIRTAVSRTLKGNNTMVYGPDQCISIHEAIEAYTTGPAWQLFREDKIGSLKVGKYADFVILSENPYQKNPEDLDKIKIVETFCGGRCNNHSNLRSLNLPSIKTLETANI